MREGGKKAGASETYQNIVVSCMYFSYDMIIKWSFLSKLLFIDLNLESFVALIRVLVDLSRKIHIGHLQLNLLNILMEMTIQYRSFQQYYNNIAIILLQSALHCNNVAANSCMDINSITITRILMIIIGLLIHIIRIISY